MYKAIGYFNTGFDIINIPNTPALLRSSASRREEYPVFDILQTRFLSSIKIKLTNANQYTNSEWALEGLDYIELVEDGSTTNQKSVFYYVSGYRLTSKDVAVLNIVQDSLLTAGVVTNGTISGNIFYKRCTIPKSLDTFGTWDLDDELLCPMEPLQLVHDGITMHDDAEGKVSHCGAAGLFFIFTHSNGRNDAQYRSYEHTMIQSAVGLTSNGLSLLSMSNLDSYLEGNTYVAATENSGEQYATVEHSRYPHPYNPRQVDVSFPTMVKYKANLADVEYRYNHNPAYVMIHYGGIEYEDLTVNGVQGALDVIRSLGMESAILACYSLPEGAGKLTNRGGANTNQVLAGMRYIISTNGWYSSGNITGEKSDVNSVQSTYAEPYNYDYLVNSLYSNESSHTAHNMRIMYGKFRKYVMCSPATGSTIEALPEELTALRWAYNGDKIGKHGAPYICCFTDPRPTGRPYYNFLKFGQSSLNDTLNLYQGAIAGGTWSEVPITFTGTAGEFQSRVGYNLDASYRDYLASPERSYRSMVSGAQMERESAVANAYGNFGINAMQSAITGGAGGAAVGGAPGAAAGAIGGVAKSAMDTAFAEARANVSYSNRLEAANYDMLRGATGNYNEAMQGNVTANNLVERARARDYERAKFELSMEYSVPRANFMATDTMRDITENCLFYARYTPTVKDLERMDHILDAYGYKVNSFNQYGMGLGVGRSRYCYMEGNIEYNGTVANLVGGKDMLADINAQLANGVRVWKIKPDGVLNPGD